MPVLLPPVARDGDNFDFELDLLKSAMPHQESNPILQIIKQM
jgi:hypothetical protein